nr:hypothetical protein [Tanacetum cinerariifolium]
MAVFAITEGHAANTSGTIMGTLFIYGHAVFVLFDTGATHSVISSAFALRVTTTPTLLDHVLCISTPMQDSVRITHVYRNLPLQFDDKIHAINALPLDMCEFDIILEEIMRMMNHLNDDDDDDDVEKDEVDKEEEEHPAPADPYDVSIDDLVPSS